uniref:C2H2-type domain-containing protein n=1 Tax=Wuchereria bancrofti TaxID=6293 RepID=A0AAF5PJH2_WUCBA
MSFFLHYLILQMIELHILGLKNDFDQLIEPNDSKCNQHSHFLQLKRNMVIADDKQSNICDKCNQSLTLRTFKKQDANNIIDMSYHQCNSCSLSFPKSELLERHYRSLHTAERPYQCSICGRSFSQRDYLQNHHKLVHTKKLLYQCDCCSRSFDKSGELEFHIKVMHSVERPYHCDICNRAFRDIRFMRRHRLYHKREIHIT